MNGRERLERFLNENGVRYQVISHPLTFTARETADVEHVSGRRVMKVVIVEAGDRPAMVVAPAVNLVNTEKVGALLGVRHARLADEEEFAHLFPDCEVGAMPPFGNLYGVPVYVDASFLEMDEVIFAAGNHRESITMRYHDFARLVRPVVADLIVLPRPALLR